MAHNIRISRVLFLLSFVSFLSFLVFDFYFGKIPTVTSGIRLCLLLTIAAGIAAAGFAILTWGSMRTLFITVVVLLMSVVAFLLSSDYDRSRLSASYIEQLQRFRGSTYIWGGERKSGIDCSGLARVALFRAAFKESLLSFNGRLFTKACLFWWRDLTAKDMGAGTYGYSHRITEVMQLAGMDNAPLKRGDLAVTKDGVHVFIYCGDGYWIEANPSDRGVVYQKAVANSPRSWFRKPVVIVRWWVL